MTVAGEAAVLRVAKQSPRLDCPENYASLYLPAAGAEAFYIFAQAASPGDLDPVPDIVSSIRIGPR